MPRPREPVGLEYSIVVVICVSSLHRGLSGGDVVLVRESAEDVSSADPVLSEVDLRWPGVSLSRCELTEGTVRPGRVGSSAFFYADKRPSRTSQPHSRMKIR
jgi:hypothetical protein